MKIDLDHKIESPQNEKIYKRPWAKGYKFICEK